MALNLKSKEVDALAAEVALLAHESKTEAVRKALLERKARLTTAKSQKRSERSASILQEFRKTLPAGLLGKRLGREEEDDLLGYGPGGV